MNHQAIKLGQYSSQSSKFSSLSELLLFSISRRQRAAATGKRLLQVAAGKDHPNKQPNNLHDMDKRIQSSDHDVNNIMSVMEESFGPKYATRCDDEGFGGIYGGNEECNNEGVMEESFGSKYATRCNDEGFGGIYGGNEECNEGVMEESFGSKYATRCDDEGFGGIYGSNEENNTEIKINKDPAHHGSSNGNEVKEKEHTQNPTRVTKKA